MPPAELIRRASELFGLPLEYFLGQPQPAPALYGREGEPLAGHAVREEQASYTTAAEHLSPARPAHPRTFSTDAERVAYTLGVLDMAESSNAEVARCLTSAKAALLAPIEAVVKDGAMLAASPPQPVAAPAASPRRRAR